jgi:hypothetical protein
MTQFILLRLFTVLLPQSGFVQQGLSLKFRVLSIHFTSEPFEAPRKMGGIFQQFGTLCGKYFRSAAYNFRGIELLLDLK